MISNTEESSDFAKKRGGATGGFVLLDKILIYEEILNALMEDVQSIPLAPKCTLCQDCIRPLLVLRHFVPVVKMSP